MPHDSRTTSISGFNHVGIQVRDVERSTRFYTQTA